VLPEGVTERIRQSDGLIAFCTHRAGRETEAFNTHVWVRDEIVFALGLGLPLVEVREEGVVGPEGLVGNRQRILLRQEDRLASIAELVTAVSGWGVFTIYAKAIRKDGSVVALEHELTLRLPDGRRNLA